jgi:cation:H+ antiporter
VPAWLIFLASAAAVAVAGTRLARDGDQLGELTGLGGLWIGAILVAGATSLPELVTDISAIRQGNAGLAVGDLFGSSMANMMILAIADLATPRTYLLTKVEPSQAIIGVLAMCLTTVAAIGVVLHSQTSVLWMGPAMFVLAVIYPAGMRLLHRNRVLPTEVIPGRQVRRPFPELRRPLLGFGLSAVAILVAAPFLAGSAADLAQQLGLEHGFAGMLLLAITTSLPEVAVTAASIRSRTYSLAVGNLLGSNCFNMVALVPLDLVNGPTPLLGQVPPTFAASGLLGVLMMSVVLLDFLNRAPRRRFGIEPGPGALVLIYLVGLYLVYRVAG